MLDGPQPLRPITTVHDAEVQALYYSFFGTKAKPGIAE